MVDERSASVKVTIDHGDGDISWQVADVTDYSDDECVDILGEIVRRVRM